MDANALPTPFGTGRPSGDRRCRCWGLHGPGHGATGIGGLRRRGHPEDGPSVPARSGGRRRPTRNTLKAPTTVDAPGPVRGRLFVLLRTEHDLVPRWHRGASATPLAFGCGAVTAVGRSRGRGRLVGGAPRCAGVVEVDGGPAATRTVLRCGCLGCRRCGFDVGSADRSACDLGRFGPGGFLHLGFGAAEPCGSRHLAGFGPLGPVWELAGSAALRGAWAVIADRDTEPVGLRTTGGRAQRLVHVGTPGRGERARSRVVGMPFGSRSRIHPGCVVARIASAWRERCDGRPGGG